MKILLKLHGYLSSLKKTEDIKPFNILVEELVTGSDAIKDTIIQIAEDFEKEYPEDYDWNAADTEYLTEVQLYAKRRLVEEFGSDSKKIKIGDIVKVIAATKDASNPDKKKEYIPIGTICTVIHIETFSDVVEYALDPGDGFAFWYLEDEFEKGHMEWIKDE